MRLSIVGVTGSGKTTLAREVARRLAIPHVELDALHWEANWREAPRDVFRDRVVRALSGDAWVTDGNYGQVRDLVWARADHLVWLDYPLGLVLSRLIRRTLRRVLTGEELWNGNRERLLAQLTPADSIIAWALKTHPEKRRRYPRLLASPECAHLRIARHRSPLATARWLRTLRRAMPGEAWA